MALGAPGIDHEGISAGRTDALERLVGARGDSVIAYCLELAGPQNAGLAAAEAMARFRAAITTLGANSRVETDVLLLAATRHAAAATADLDGLWTGATSKRGSACERLPTMLAARALGQLTAPELERVEKHLARCDGCRLVAAAFARAEQAYREPGVDPDADETGLMITALKSAGPLIEAPAPESAGEQSIFDTLDPGGFLDEADIDPRNQPTLIFDVLDVESGYLESAVIPARRANRSALDDGDFVAGRSATFAYSLLAMAAVILVLGLTYAVDGLPSSNDASKPKPAVTTPAPPPDPVPTTPATG